MQYHNRRVLPVRKKTKKTKKKPSKTYTNDGSYRRAWLAQEKGEVQQVELEMDGETNMTSFGNIRFF